MKRLLFLSKLFAATMLCSPFAAMAQVTIGSLEAPERAALLDIRSHAPDANNITSEEGGLLLPRVELEDLHSLAPLIAGGGSPAEKLSHTGLVVYNVTDDDMIDLLPGFYYWTGGEWAKMLTEITKKTLNKRNLVPATPASTTVGVPLSFGSPIIISETGEYAFSFRLYGSVANVGGGNLPNNAKCTFYINLYIDGIYEKTEEIVLYTAVPNATTATRVMSYSVTMPVHAHEGQEIAFTLAHDTSTPRQWTLVGVAANSNVANRTSLIWWRL